MQNPALYLILAFFLGSLPFGHWLAMSRGIDLRLQGSKNTGATNVGRVLGKKWGVLIFLLDLGKGWMPVFAAKSIGQIPDSWAIGVGLCAVLGHVFSPWLGFRGGKGVATSAGILIGLTPWVALGIGIVWGVIFQFSRTVSVASLGAAALFPFLVFWINPQQTLLQWAAIGMTGLVWVRHRDNIWRLFQGNENRFSKKDKP